MKRNGAGLSTWPLDSSCRAKKIGQGKLAKKNRKKSLKTYVFSD